MKHCSLQACEAGDAPPRYSVAIGGNIGPKIQSENLIDSRQIYLPQVAVYRRLAGMASNIATYSAISVLTQWADALRIHPERGFKTKLAASFCVKEVLGQAPRA
jgi:hypothetical protein